MNLYRITSPDSVPVLMELETEKGEPLANLALGKSGSGRKDGTVPITGKGAEIRVKKTDKGLVLVRGDWRAEDRCLVMVEAGCICSMFGVDRVDVYVDCDHEIALLIVEKNGVLQLSSNPKSNIPVPVWHTWDGERWLMESYLQMAVRVRINLREEQPEGDSWL